MTTQDDPLLAPLRRDLEFYPGPPELDGAPTCAIHDPLGGTYDKMGWAEAQVLLRLRVPRRLSSLLAELRRFTPLAFGAEDVLALHREATARGLTLAGVVAPVDRLLQLQAQRRVRPLWWMLQHYLYIRVPLLRPDRFLARTVERVGLLGGRTARWLYLLLGLAGLFFLLQRPGEYFATFPDFFSWQGAFYYGLTVLALKLLHEFSHAYVAKSFGVRVRSMGVVFMVLMPIPFSDVTDAWQLPDRKRRLLIALAGILSELVLAGVALFFWGISPSGVWRDLCFIVSSVTLASTLLVNLNPAMRFDGYYILADIWGIDNLQPRAFALSKWALRKALLGLDLPPPEEGVSRRRLIGLMFYAVYAWIYRIGLYFGIALLVYAKFTKVVGVALFFAEIGFFFVRPVVNETATLIGYRRHLRFNLRLLATLLALAALLAWLALPLPRWVGAPAIAVPQASQTLYAAHAGRVVEMTAERGDPVEKGRALLRIESIELESAFRQQQTELAILQREREVLVRSEEGRAFLEEKVEQIAQVRAELQRLRELRRGSVVRAGIDGVLIEWDEALRPGAFVRDQAVLGRIAEARGLQLQAYVAEADAKYIDTEAEAVFIPAGGGAEWRCRVVDFGTVRAETLPYLPLSSLLRGEIAVTERRDGTLAMRESRFEMTLALRDVQPPPRIKRTGRLWLRTTPRSRLWDGLLYVYAVLVRESGF